MKFEVLALSYEAVEALRPLLEIIRRNDRDLAKQVRRAASSVPRNIAEGNRRAGRDRLQHFRVAAGSADEVVAALRVAVAWGDLSYRETVDALSLLDRILAMLHRLIHGRGGKP